MHNNGNVHTFFLTDGCVELIDLENINRIAFSWK